MSSPGILSCSLIALVYTFETNVVILTSSYSLGVIEQYTYPFLDTRPSVLLYLPRHLGLQLRKKFQFG